MIKEQANNKPKMKTGEIILMIIILIMFSLAINVFINTTVEDSNKEKVSDAALKYVKNKYHHKNVEVIDVNRYRDYDYDKYEYKVTLLLDEIYEFELLADLDDLVIDNDEYYSLAYANLSRILGFENTKFSLYDITRYYKELLEDEVKYEIKNKYNSDISFYVSLIEEKLDDCLDYSLTKEFVEKEMFTVDFSISLKEVYEIEEKEVFINDMINIYNDVTDNISLKKIGEVSIIFRDYNHFVTDGINKNYVNLLTEYDDYYEFSFGTESFKVNK